ncbi:MAG: hypothetical protein M1826_003950, partial [Phylliscum demangeonii]
MTPSISAQATGVAAAATAIRHPFWSSHSKVAGLFTGIGLLVLGLAVAVAVGWWRARQQRASGKARAGKKATPSKKGQSTSEGMLVQGHGARESGPSPADQTRSSPPVVDQRLDPAAFPKTHASVRSVKDSQDYSRRVLRVANPEEPRPSRWPSRRTPRKA